MASLIKHTGEKRLYEFDFALQTEVAGGETINTPVVSSSIVGAGVATPALTIGTPNVVGSKVQFTLEAGAAGTTYRLKCTVNTSGGKILQGIGDLEVNDTP